MPIKPENLGFDAPEWARCADCGVDTAGEYYMVKKEIWTHAWAGRPKPPGHQILCIGCLEKRIGRTLTKYDFTDTPVNDPDGPLDYKSDRLLNRLRATESHLVKGEEGQ